MKIEDIGPKPNSFDLEKATIENDVYRRVAWTGKYLQMTLMSIEPGQSIGLEVHPETDQFLRLDAGEGHVRMGPNAEDITFTEEVSDGWCIFVPAGMWHDVINTGKKPMRLYAIYAPSHHAAGKVHKTFAESEADEESGNDEPPAWTVQPSS